MRGLWLETKQVKVGRGWSLFFREFAHNKSNRQGTMCVSTSLAAGAAASRARGHSVECGSLIASTPAPVMGAEAMSASVAKQATHRRGAGAKERVSRLETTPLFTVQTETPWGRGHGRASEGARLDPVVHLAARARHGSFTVGAPQSHKHNKHKNAIPSKNDSRREGKEAP